VQKAERRQAVAVSIAEDVDISRGAMLSRAGNPAPCSDGFYADILWLEKKYAEKQSFSGTIKLHHREEQAQVTIEGENTPLKQAFIYLANPAPMDTYAENPAGGLFILIDPYTEKVAGVGTITSIVDYDYPDVGAI
jgi:sulfate adenylyltransferase subunit 1 (EFTu-like GTPase family)